MSQAEAWAPQDAELPALMSAAAGGDADAQLALGSRLLLGRQAPLAPQEALALFRESASAGNAEAVNLLASLTAAGVHAPQSWDGALDLLRDAAAMGSAAARGQLTLLTGVETIDEGLEYWAQVRAAVDLAPWLAPPRRLGLCEAPRIRACEGFVSPAICDWLIGRARGGLQPAAMAEGARSGMTAPHGDFVFNTLSADVIVSLLRARIEALTRMPEVAMAPSRLLHFDAGQGQAPHVDFLPRDPSGGYQGDRLATFHIYLNDDYDGGEIEFPRADFRHKGRQGDACYFANIDAAGAQDPMSLHAALPPTRGEKWLFSQWIHDRPYSA